MATSLLITIIRGPTVLNVHSLLSELVIEAICLLFIFSGDSSFFWSSRDGNGRFSMVY